MAATTANPQLDGDNSDNTSNARTNARTFEDDSVIQMPGQIPAQMPGDNSGHLDQASDWAQLWRIEKDGEHAYRWRLRFSKSKRGRAGGQITPEIKKLIRKRPGKGRHSKSRIEAERFRGAVKYIENRLRSSAGSRPAGQVIPDSNRSRVTASNNSNGEREQMSELPGMVDWKSVSELPMN